MSSRCCNVKVFPCLSPPDRDGARGLHRLRTATCQTSHDSQHWQEPCAAFSPHPSFTPPAQQGAELRPLPESHIYNSANRRGNGAGWCDLPRIQRLTPFFLLLSGSVHVMCFCGQCEVTVLHSLLGGRGVLPSGILLALQKGSKMSMHSAEVQNFTVQNSFSKGASSLCRFEGCAETDWRHRDVKLKAGQGGTGSLVPSQHKSRWWVGSWCS